MPIITTTESTDFLAGMDEEVIREHDKAYMEISTFSMLSMAFGIFSAVCFIFVVLFRGDPPNDLFIVIVSTVAIVTGIIALIKMRKYPHLVTKGMAVTGLATGGAILLLYFSFIITVLVKMLWGAPI